MKIKSIPWDGKAITKPGIYSNIPLDAYHSATICDGHSVSSSMLRTIDAKSPAHMYARWAGNPDRVEDDDKNHFTLGRALHHLVLGERFFANLFCEQPDAYPDQKTGELKKWTYAAGYCKEWRLARKKEGRSILTPDQIRRLKGMAIELGANPIVRAGALNGLIERSIFFKDKDTGLWIKVRPDSIPGDSGDFVDLKTTTSVVWTDLVRTIGDYGYHMQGALIRRAAREVLKIERPTFALVFQESEVPHCTRVVTVKDAELDRGDRQNEVAIRTFAACLKAKRWPGPGGDREDAEYIELSEYMQKRIDDRLQYELPQ